MNGDGLCSGCRRVTEHLICSPDTMIIARPALHMENANTHLGLQKPRKKSNIYWCWFYLFYFSNLLRYLELYSIAVRHLVEVNVNDRKQCKLTFACADHVFSSQRVCKIYSLKYLYSFSILIFFVTQLIVVTLILHAIAKDFVHT